MRFMIVILMGFPSLGFGQSVLWENIVDCKPWQLEVWRSIEQINDGEFLISGTCGNDYIATFHWIDFQGDSLNFLIDSTNQFFRGTVDMGIDDHGNIYTCGNQTVGGYLAKFDPGGNFLWEVPLNQTNGISNTHCLLVLNDGSVVVSGMRLQDQILYFGNMFYYHIDPHGNILSESHFPQISGTETAYDILEMHDGSFLFFGWGSTAVDQRPYYVLTDSKFNKLSSGYLTIPGIELVLLTRANLNVDKGVVFSGQEYLTSINPNHRDFIVWLDSGLNVIWDTTVGDAFLGHKILVDSSIVGFGTEENLESFVCRFDPDKQLLSKDVYGTDGRAINDVAFDTAGRMVGVGGIPDTATILHSFYTVGFDSMGFEYEPDYCLWSPPRAEFGWSYDFPILTLYDSSFSGLIYRDSIYGHQWSSSYGDTSSQPVFQVVFDTALSNSVDIGLTITNWHGCQDSIMMSFDAGIIGSVLKKKKNHALRLFPNPTGGMVQLSIESKIMVDLEGDLRVQDLHGETLLRQSIHTAEPQVDLVGFPPGIYVLSVEINGEHFFKKVVKK